MKMSNPRIVVMIPGIINRKPAIKKQRLSSKYGATVRPSLKFRKRLPPRRLKIKIPKALEAI